MPLAGPACNVCLLGGKTRRAAAAVFHTRVHPPTHLPLLPPQIAVIEFARNVLHMENANSTEVEPATEHPVR